MHGGRAVTPTGRTLQEEIQEAVALYPERHSAVLAALRLAQERHGWLSRDAIEQVADALGETPAYCLSIASFYDQFHLKPIGRTLVEVCTNVSCALAGAQQVLEAFEDELGIEAGRTRADGAYTLRTVECLGGCGWATVVAVDNQHRLHVKPEDVPGIVEELERGDA
jgi:NADH-quinone oxidoreductase E subunit